MNLTDKQKEIIIDAGKFGFDAKKIALLIDLEEKEVIEALQDSNTDIFNCYQKGNAAFLLDACRQLEIKANAGDRQAVKELIKLTNEIKSRQLKNELFGI